MYVMHTTYPAYLTLRDKVIVITYDDRPYKAPNYAVIAIFLLLLPSSTYFSPERSHFTSNLFILYRVLNHALH